MGLDKMYYFLVFNTCHILLELSVIKDNIGGTCSMNWLDRKRIQVVGQKMWWSCNI